MRRNCIPQPPMLHAPDCLPDSLSIVEGNLLHENLSSKFSLRHEDEEEEDEKEEEGLWIEYFSIL